MTAELLTDPVRGPAGDLPQRPQSRDDLDQRNPEHASPIPQLVVGSGPQDLKARRFRSRGHPAGQLEGQGQRLAPQVSDRLRILTGTARPVRTPPPPTALEQVWSVARLIADVVVVDAGAADVAEPGVGASALAAADQVLVVGLPDPVGLARLVTTVQELRATDSTAELHVLLNRMRRQGFGAGEVDKALALAGVVADRTWQVPDEVASIDRALAAGRALASVAPRSPMRQSMRTLRAGLAGATAAPRRWGWRLAAAG